MKKLVSVCVFLLALVTGVFAMAQEPVYGVLVHLEERVYP